MEVVYLVYYLLIKYFEILLFISLNTFSLKCDLAESSLNDNAQQMDEFCQEKSFDKWFETSAKENTNIETAIQYLISEVIFYLSFI